jgi:serine phosphatase RsbU (regulator of sigma subunit)
MKHVAFISALLFLWFYSSLPLYAQQGYVELNGRIIDESGHPIGDVKVSVENGKYVQATSMGKFRASVPVNTSDFKNVKVYKSGYKLNTTKFDKDAKDQLTIQLVKLSQNEILNAKTIRGNLYNANGVPIRKAWITVDGVSLMDVAITNEKGVFYLRIPPDETFSNKSKILVDGKHANASFVKYDDKKMTLYIMLKGEGEDALVQEGNFNEIPPTNIGGATSNKSGTYEVNIVDENAQPLLGLSVNAWGIGFFTTDKKGKFTIESKDIQSVKFIIKGFDKIKTDYTADKVIILVKSQLPRAPRTEEAENNKTKNDTKSITTENQVEKQGDYSSHFNAVNDELSREKELFEQSGEKVRFEIDKINEQLNKDKSLNESQKQILQSYLNNLDELLNDNAKVFEHNQSQTKSRLQMISSVINAKNKIDSDMLEEMKKEKEEMESDFKKNIWAISSVAGIFGLITIVAFSLARYLNNQKKKLEETNKKLAIATEQLSEKVDEINQKNEEMSVQTENLQKINQELHKKDANITASLNYAQRLQKATFPQVELIQQSLPQFFTFFKPRDIVSGDFYWFTEKTNPITGHKQIFLASADCTGHGVPGAFMSMVGDALLEKVINTQGISSPEKILAELHHGIRYMLNQEESENRDGMDMGLCVINKSNKTIEFSGAKHSLFYIQDGELHTAKGTMMSLGGLQLRDLGEEKSFVKQIIDVNKPTTCYLFSDGFPDQFGAETGKKYSKQRLSELLLRIYREDFEKQKDILESELGNWKKDTKQTDDVLVMGFRV